MRQRTNAGRLEPNTRTALAWMTGGALWLAAGAAGGGSRGLRFDVTEAVWLIADVALLAGLVGLRRLGLHGPERLGRIGIGTAIVGRLVFVAAEVVSVVQRKDENLLLPAAALLSAIGMVAYGAAVVRGGQWPGSSRFGPLAMGLYPFLVMFPLLAASGGSAPIGAIAGWGVAAIVVGACTLARAGTTSVATGLAQRAASTGGAL